MRSFLFSLLLIAGLLAVGCRSNANEGSSPSPSAEAQLNPCPYAPGAIANYYVVIDAVGSDSFSGPATTRASGPLDEDSVTIRVTSSTNWNGPIQGLADLRPGMLWVQAVGRVQEDCSIVAVNILSPSDMTPIPDYTPGALRECPLYAPGQFANVLLVVKDVGSDGFDGSFQQGIANLKTVTVHVTSDTKWSDPTRGLIRGLADLRPGMRWIHVLGTRQGGWGDCSVVAETIWPEWESPTPMSTPGAASDTANP
jgi:hypothetical protein